jgi:hypothetical protein
VSFKGRAQAAVPGLIDGEVGVLAEIKGRTLLGLKIGFADDDRIAAIEVVANRDALAGLVLQRFGDAPA